uniref:Uncharacterized protein n=1 Tax=Anguilla anguilla TaxID=7936 RepID=A0A0E9R8D2_ANGAN
MFSFLPLTVTFAYISQSKRFSI